MTNELEVTDAQLLGHYVTSQDSAAFREVVSRHGPAVLRVCKFVLRDPHEAEDAFQATFLVFIRRAPSIRNPDALGRWLCGVAYRVASRSRNRLVHQRRLERNHFEKVPFPDLPEGLCPEIRRIVREELDRLPENYLAPLLLCYFHDLTHQEAAKHLGWPAGTVKVRLVRGRNLLRERLERRGVALGLAFLLFGWKHDAKAAVTQKLRDSTVLAMGRSKATGPIRPGAVIGPAPMMRSIFARESRISTPRRLLIAGLVAALVGISGHFAFAHPKPMSDRDPSSLPSNLTDVLGMDCH